MSPKKTDKWPGIAGRNFSGEWKIRSSRSQGPGGQYVNKTDTRVELRFHLASSKLLTENEKEILQKRLGKKLTEDGFLIITSQAERSQIRNRRVAEEKFYRLVDQMLTVRKARKPTKRTVGSNEKRLERKKTTADKKNLRKKPAL